MFQFTRHATGTRYYMGSADLMPRNLDARVEVVTPVEDPQPRTRSTRCSARPVRQRPGVAAAGRRNVAADPAGRRRTRALRAGRADGASAGGGRPGRAREPRRRDAANVSCERGGDPARRRCDAGASRSSTSARTPFGSSSPPSTNGDRSSCTPTRCWPQIGRSLGRDGRIDDDKIAEVARHRGRLRRPSPPAGRPGHPRDRDLGDARGGERRRARRGGAGGVRAWPLEIIDEDEEARLAFFGALASLDEPSDGRRGSRRRGWRLDRDRHRSDATASPGPAPSASAPAA